MTEESFKNSPEYELWIKETGGHIEEKNHYREKYQHRLRRKEAEKHDHHTEQK
ncbi:hypothetical protein [Psychrobacter sp. I-STPA10]|uniref:hypothetical protein n=1 Tax=Psychrobacter sp. I-STPA10 TaxID=2585769 RepID=UPI001E54CC90|nr:hypothetical protein [Psychrobacter sp. I-STPA10]